MEKLTKTAKVIDIVLKVMFWAVIASCLLALSVSYMMYTGGDFQNSGLILNIGGVTLNAADMGIETARRAWLVGSVIYAAAAFAACVMLRMLSGILRPMREGKPFDGSVSEKLRRLGWFSLICGVADVLFELFGTSFIMRLLTTGGGMMQVEHRINLWLFVITGLIFLFSYIFRYGEELQKLSDETL